MRKADEHIMKTRYLLIFTLILTVVLASCSNKEDERQKKTTKEGEMKVGEMMQEDKERVWFVATDTKTPTLEKASIINRYIITKNGKMKIYVANTPPKPNLDRMLEMNQKELIKEIKYQDRRYFKSKAAELYARTDADIDNAKDIIKVGIEDYNESRDSHGGSDYALLAHEQRGQSPEESLKKLEKYKHELDTVKYEPPKAQKVDLHTIGSGVLELSTARNYNFPKGVGSADHVDETKQTIQFSNTYQPKEIKGKRLAGLNNYYEDTKTDEGTSPYMVTIVDDKIKKVSLDKGGDPAIKDNQKFKHEKGS